MRKKIDADRDPRHRMGKRCGYAQLSETTIQPAPQYADEFERLSLQQQGINNMLKMVTSTAADMLSEIQRRQRELWDDICDDYGFDQETHHITWDGFKITATPISPETPETVSEVHE